jgi:hypothetical protein
MNTTEQFCRRVDAITLYVRQKRREAELLKRLNAQTSLPPRLLRKESE